MDTKKRALGPGAKCCGHCDLCAPDEVTEQTPTNVVWPESDDETDPDELEDLT